MPWVGINMIQPPRDEAATGMLDRGREQVLYLGRSQQSRPVGVPRSGHPTIFTYGFDEASDPDGSMAV